MLLSPALTSFLLFLFLVCSGQKQRTAIARAVYAALSDACDSVFLDDPLSAVDAHVARALFDNVLSRGSGVLGSRGVTTILAMNQLHFLPKGGIAQVVVMEQGRIVQQGTYEELMNQPQGQLANLLANYGFSHKDDEDEANKKENTAGDAESKQDDQAAAVQPMQTARPVSPAAAMPVLAPADADLLKSSKSKPLDTAVTTVTVSANGTADGAAKKGVAVSGVAVGQITQAELRLEGSIHTKVYLSYMRASGGWWVAIAIILLFCIHQAGRVAQDFWYVFAHAHPLRHTHQRCEVLLAPVD
jgi:ABC-type methionine transport system ATPase subunit